MVKNKTKKEVNKYLNKKALVSYCQIFILIVASFAFSYAIGEIYGGKDETILDNNLEVKKSEIFSLTIRIIWNFFKPDFIKSVDALGLGEVCCEETVTGNTCAEIPEENCKIGVRKVLSSCSSTEFCKPGCCVSPTNGLCNKGTTKRDCELSGGKFSQDANCNIQECNKGCCKIGTNTLFTTQANCIWEGNLQGQQMETNWDAEVNSYVKCLLLADKNKDGACVYKLEEQTKCIKTSLEACLDRTGSEANFYANTLCSTLSLNTTCTSKHHKDCVASEEDVYWFDSCNNKEDIAKDCDFYRGNYCKKTGTDADCKDIRCDTNGDGVNDRANGESWCSYDGAIGDGKDPAGSRHVKHICAMGTERLAPCSDYRNEICVQEDSSINGKSFSQAACRTNQWRQCLEYNREKNTEKLVSKCEKNVDCKIKNIDMTTSSGGKGDFKFKVCLPQYPPGLDVNPSGLYDEEGNLNLDSYFDSTSGQQVCDMATTTCTTTWQCCLIFFIPVCWCIANCDCHTGKFPKDMNDFCTRLGDCGSYINYIGKATNEGHNVNGYKAPSKLSDGEIQAMSKYADVVPEPAKPGDYSFFEETLDISGLRAIESGGSGNFSAFERELMESAGAYGSPLLMKILKEKVNETSASSGLVPSTTTLSRFGSVGSIQSLLLSQNPYSKPSAPPDLSMPIALIGGLITYLISQSIIATMLVSLLFFLIFGPCWIEEHDVNFYCMQWEPPVGGDDCNECNKLDVPCTEYRCESLGQSCQLINKGTGKEICVTKPENETLPVITPFQTAITKGYSYSQVSENWIKIINDSDSSGCIEPWTKVEFGIKVSPFAKCRFGDNPEQSYSQMANIFGPKGNYILPAHLNELFFISPESYKSRIQMSDEQIRALCESGNIRTLNDFVGQLPANFRENLTPEQRALLEQYENGQRNINCEEDYKKVFQMTDSELQTLGKKDIYVRCKTTSGKINPVPYHIEACVKPGPDLTPPRISPITTPLNGAYLKYDEREKDITVYTNEPSECKWSTKPGLKFEQMENSMTCDIMPNSKNLGKFPCTSKITGLNNNTKIYIKCKDFSDKKNEMTEDFVFEFKLSSSVLSISDIIPKNGDTRTVNVEPASVELKLRTSGGANDGNAVCNFSGRNGRYGDYFNYRNANGSNIHGYQVTLGQGSHTIDFSCIDVAGNIAVNSTSFNIDVDRFGPNIIRIYYDGGLKIATSENAECRYSFQRTANFENATRMGGDGYEHNAGWVAKTYYIQCRDNFGNMGSRISAKPLFR